MTSPDGTGYSGPTEIMPTNVTNIREPRADRELRGSERVGDPADQQRGFAVSTLTDPFRIVIDIELDPGGAPAPTPTTAPTTVPGAPPVSLPPTR